MSNPKSEFAPLITGIASGISSGVDATPISALKGFDQAVVELGLSSPNDRLLTGPFLQMGYWYGVLFKKGLLDQIRPILETAWVMPVFDGSVFDRIPRLADIDDDELVEQMFRLIHVNLLEIGRLCTPSAAAIDVVAYHAKVILGAVADSGVPLPA